MNPSKKRKLQEIQKYQNNQGTCSLCLIERNMEDLTFCQLDKCGTIGFRCHTCIPSPKS